MCMKKLLALLLLSPLAFAEQSSGLNDGTNTLDLESLSQFFPNDSYIGLTCSDEEDKSYSHLLQYRMYALSTKDNQGVTLIQAEFADCENSCTDFEKTKFSIEIKDKFNRLEVSDFSIKMDDWYYEIYLNRTTLKLGTLGNFQCEISSQEQMKDFGYKIAKKIQDFEKIKKDLEEARLNARKI